MLPLNLSYSSLETLHECARKFELEKLLAPEGIGNDDIDLVCGKSFGVGLQSLLAGCSLERAVWEAYLAWTFPERDRVGVSRDYLVSSSRGIGEMKEKYGKPHKAFFLVVQHLDKAQFTLKEKFFDEGWRLWKLPSGRPACEVGFRIALPGGAYQRGFLDAILVRELPGTSRQYACLEIKTSGFENINPAYYQNSSQGNSYSFIVDYLTEQVNPVCFYFIAEFPKLGQQVMDFYKGPADKVSWLPALAIDLSMIDLMMRAKHFPMNGKACMNYFRQCKFFGVCNLSRTGEWKAHEREEAGKFDYNFSLEELMKVRDKIYGV